MGRRSIFDYIKVGCGAGWHYPAKGDLPPYRYPGTESVSDRSITVLVLDGTGLAHVGYYDYMLCAWFERGTGSRWHEACTIRTMDNDGNYRLKWAYIRR